jgi:hypothetical protein
VFAVLTSLVDASYAYAVSIFLPCSYFSCTYSLFVVCLSMCLCLVCWFGSAAAFA